VIALVWPSAKAELALALDTEEEQALKALKATRL